MLRDVDMSGCYARIIEGINVYWGRPVVHEPGGRPIGLAEAVTLLGRHCDDDAWYVRVTGDIRAGFNTLIPSTLGAITSANYRARKPRGPELKGAELFSGRIESGVVTHATWQMIQSLPSALRGEYERLSADSLVFYPRKLVAGDGAEYDRMVARLGLGALPWDGEVDLEALTRTQVEHLDADYVSLKFAIGDVARSIGERRRKARASNGQGTGLEMATKLQANSIFGVLASPHFATGNAVAAQVITATGRAGAFAMVNSLNGIQVITDGCTYRRDQIPACPFSECLRLQPDYALRRAEDGGPIPFLDPAEVPVDDAGFTAWYRGHARRFFGRHLDDRTEPYELHDQRHKLVVGGHSFDGLACEGGGGYVKCSRADNGEWKIEQMAMRGHGRSSQDSLGRWILSNYPVDHLAELPPVTLDKQLLNVKESIAKANRFLDEGCDEVVFPLGHEHSKVLTYKTIRPSAFVFRDPKQSRAIRRQMKRFTAEHGVGLEVLTLRRGYKGRRAGSFKAILESIFDLIQSGKHDLSKAMHLSRPSEAIKTAAADRMAEAKRHRAEALQDLRDRVKGTGYDPSLLMAAIFCSKCRPRRIQTQNLENPPAPRTSTPTATSTGRSSCTTGAGSARSRSGATPTLPRRSTSTAGTRAASASSSGSTSWPTSRDWPRICPPRPTVCWNARPGPRSGPRPR